MSSFGSGSSGDWEEDWNDDHDISDWDQDDFNSSLEGYDDEEDDDDEDDLSLSSITAKSKSSNTNENLRQEIKRLHERVISLESEMYEIKNKIRKSDEDDKIESWDDIDSHIGLKVVCNDLILAKIFSKLPLKDLKKCRLVNKKWSKIGCSEMRNRIVLYFGGEKDKRHTKMLEYVSLVEKNKEQKSISSQYYFDSIPLGSSLVGKFFSICGPTIKILSLNLLSHHIDVNSFKKIFVSCPNLDYITLQLPSNFTNSPDFVLFEEGQVKPKTQITKIKLVPPNQDADEFNPNTKITEEFSLKFLTELFTICFNVQNISLTSMSNTQAETFLNALDQTKLVANITKLNLDVPLTPKDVKRLIRFSYNLKLKDLSIQGFLGALANEVGDFLEKQKNNLFRLEIKHSKETTDNYFRLPDKMENLTSLALKIAPNVSYSFSDFSKKFPSLKQLKVSTWLQDDFVGNAVVDNWKENFSCDAIESQDPHNTLEYLEIPKIIDNFNLIEKIPLIFPMIKIVKIELLHHQEKIIRALFSNWNNTLEELHLNFLIGLQTPCLDSVLTGINDDECKRIIKEQSFLYEDFAKLPTEKNIGHLQKLKVIHFKSDLNDRITSPGSKLTDLTLYFIMAQCKNITTIVIHGYPYKISRCAASIVRKKKISVEVVPYKD